MKIEEGPVLGVPCRDCGAYALRLEFRTELHARPLGTWSLSGNQLKTSAVEVQWPWMVCHSCKSECKGKIDDE